MRIKTVHAVRKPFLCRMSQFRPGERELCVGLSLDALNKTDQFKCYLGDNREVFYEIKSSVAISKGQQWRNPEGKDVMIVPISIFKKSGLYKKENPYQENVSMAQAFSKMPADVKADIRKKLGLPPKDE